MNSRHKKLGIKQTIRKEWMDKVVHMLLAGTAEADIRLSLDEYLSTQKQSGGVGERGKKTYGMAISVLAAWFAPNKDLLAFRDEALAQARGLYADMWLPLHWALISASYPFWFHVAQQVGRLLNLQDQITQPQVFNRLKEQYGDRETVARNARYTVRSFVAWGVLKDSAKKGCYEKAAPIGLYDEKVTGLLYEAALHALPEGKAALGLLTNSPAFFPFQLPLISGSALSQTNKRLDTVRFGLDDEFLKLKDMDSH